MQLTFYFVELLKEEGFLMCVSLEHLIVLQKKFIYYYKNSLPRGFGVLGRCGFVVTMLSQTLR